ncbi:MAG: amidohydrolase family protein [Actinophytocola sp.]|uniref:amidohydrolase family protein n=1 Tax=Actinophytocola sp. TaxID=1872138 RepID=UPI001327CE94|nr:amidohydrolase family protein [Actinophytocola sp.]MPZ79887.1 amidohydrolase family protein [Actinophytocola sp.]
MLDGADIGTDIGVDIYPYLAGNAPLSQLLPEWVTDGGPSVIPDRLADPVVRQRIAAAWVDNAVPWTEITVAGGATDVLGRTIAELATGRDAVDVALDLIAAHGNAVIMTAGGRSPDDLRTVLHHDSSVVASDGLALDPDGPTGQGFPHPRSFGTFPRVLAGTGGLPLATAVHKATSTPARRVGLTDRGEVRRGQMADLVVLDMERLADRATFLHPRLFPAGVEHVLVAGTMVVENGSHPASRPGDVVRRAPTK